jgi:hypothetical protein
MQPEDPERALLAALRWAIPPTVSVPLAFAVLAASASGEGLPLPLAWPPLVLALTTNASLWLKVVVLWRRLPPGDDDDDQDWRRWFGGDPPPGPNGGPGGIDFDWTSFEREFWSYVREQQSRRERERELVHARARQRESVHGRQRELVHARTRQGVSVHGRQRELVHARANEHLNEPRNPCSSILFPRKNR